MTMILIKQAYRACVVQIKNYFGVIIAIIAIAALGCYTLISQIYNSTFSFQEWIFEFALGCSALCLIILLFGKRPAFIIHPATIYFFSFSPAFGRIKAFALAKKIVGILFVTSIIGMIIYNFRISRFLAGFLLCFTLYFLSIHLIRWFRYNAEKTVLWISEYVICTGCFLLEVFYNNLYLAVLQVLITIVFVIFFFRIHIDMSRYYEDSLYIERMNDASRHKDMAVMQQITADHVANKRHKFKLGDLPINKTNILFCKALMETLRMSKQVMVIMFSLLVFAIIINTTSLFSSIPIISEPSVPQAIGMFSLTTFLVNLKELYLKHFLSIVAKQQEGLFLPYNQMRIMLSYSLLCNIVAVLAVVMVGIALQSTPVNLILSVVILLIGVNLSFVCKNKQFIIVVSNFIIITATYFLF